jgi:hypothetical protein
MIGILQSNQYGSLQSSLGEIAIFNIAVLSASKHIKLIDLKASPSNLQT